MHGIGDMSKLEFITTACYFYLEENPNIILAFFGLVVVSLCVLTCKKLK